MIGSVSVDNPGATPPSPRPPGGPPRRAGRPSNIRVINRQRAFGLVFEAFRSGVLPAFLARTEEALASWDHPACRAVWEQTALIFGEVLAAGMKPDADAEPAQPPLPFGAELIRIAEAQARTRIVDARLAAAAAPILPN